MGRAAWLGLFVATLSAKPHLSGSRYKEPTMKGTILDFLKLAAEEPKLAKKLVNFITAGFGHSPDK